MNESTVVFNSNLHNQSKVDQAFIYQLSHSYQLWYQQVISAIIDVYNSCASLQSLSENISTPPYLDMIQRAFNKWLYESASPVLDSNKQLEFSDLVDLSDVNVLSPYAIFCALDNADVVNALLSSFTDSRGQYVQ